MAGNLSLSQIGHLFSLPEIKKECFHNNRYPAILSVVYVTTILPSYCVHLSNNISEGGKTTTPPPPPPGMTQCTACNACECNVSTPLDSDHFHSSISNYIVMCVVGSESMLWITRPTRVNGIKPKKHYFWGVDPKRLTPWTPNLDVRVRTLPSRCFLRQRNLHLFVSLQLGV